MSNSSKAKGYRFEKEIVDMALDMGLDSERAWGSDGRALGMDKAVDLVINGAPFQAKRRKTIANYLVPPPGCLGTIIREDRGKPYVVLPLSWVLEVLNDED